MEYTRHRNKNIAYLFKSGVPGTILSVKYGISRERVRQILNRLKINSADGGVSVKVKKERDAKEIKWLNTFRAFYGCNNNFFYSRTKKERSEYKQHKRNSIHRGIEFYLTYPQWVEIWENSGVKDLRGRGNGRYVMSRIGDVGPYSKENIKIIPSVQNNSDSWKYKKWDLNHKKR